MATFDLTGISNQNEYYTNHYFSSLFSISVSEAISKWEKTEEEQTPWSLLSKLRNDFATLSAKYENIKRINGQYLSDITELAEDYLKVLGYTDIEPENISYKDDKLKDEIQIPIFTNVKKADGAPLLWVLLACPVGENPSLLSSKTFNSEKYKKQIDPEFSRDDVLSYDNNELSIENLATRILFNLDESPRFILVVSINQIILIDRNKWNEKRHLEFNMDEIYSRHNTTTFQALTTLLHKDCLCPEAGSALLDNFDEESQKNASGVSQDLKYALRESIELLGNAVLDDMKFRQKIDLEQNPVDAGELTLECLRYMYRMLFVLFIEARPELGFAPIKNDAYLKGYSLEALRDCADSMHIGTAEVDEGYYLYDTLTKLYHLIYNGYPSNDEVLKDLASKDTIKDCFIIPPLKAHIFDPEFTPLLEKAKIKNKTMLRIIRLMSISQGRNGGRKGRISYANLGINQMGAVYEALLSYRGFIAEHDLYEVKKAGDNFNELDVGYFVSKEDLEQYTEEERVRYEHDDDYGHKKNELRKYEKGKFIYRLAGREREKSASYYTPEVLTKCLVKYALKELLEGKTADEILNLTICEPAMGSAAFLNEAINQLAEAYLDRKQKELNDSIPFEERFNQLQKVKMYIADRNVYGVDLNPVAVELGEVSLWLNTIFKGGYVPWFGTQLVNGNSLIGARRQTYNQNQLKKGKWWEEAPERLSFDEECYTDDRNQKIYHFLTGDTGMAHYDDKVIRSLEPEKIKLMNDWNKKFTSKYNEDEIKTLKRLSGVVDSLWKKQIKLRKKLEDETKDVLSVYGHEDNVIDSKTTIRQKDIILNQAYKTKDAKNAGPYARLKFAMDYWCSLWFWPIDKAELLPDRNTFLFELSVILGGTVNSVVVDNVSYTKGNGIQMELFPTDKQKAFASFTNTIAELDEVDIPSLCKKFPRLSLVKQIAEQNHFMHWELEFANLFAEKGGFDLMIGNPPWIQPIWQEQNLLADKNPMFVVKNLSATQTIDYRNEAMNNIFTKNAYFDEYEQTKGLQNYLKSNQNYLVLSGVSTDLYKCFLPLSWYNCNKKGFSAYVHPESVYTEKACGRLRTELYKRLKKHFHFINEKMLFEEIGHPNIYSLNIYGPIQTEINFQVISNLFIPQTIEYCFNNTDNDDVGIKDHDGNWNTKGSSKRIIDYHTSDLKTLSRLSECDVFETPLMAIQTKSILTVLNKIAKIYNTEKECEYMACSMWHETYAQQDGITLRFTDFAKFPDVIYSGPHFSVGNPYGKTARRQCNEKGDYDLINLDNIPENYLPRTNYIKYCTDERYLKEDTICYGKRYNDCYKLVSRLMLNIKQERTLNVAVLPPKFGHINGVMGTTFKNLEDLIRIAPTWMSLPFDFYVKVLGKTNFTLDTIRKLPILNTIYNDDLIIRFLLLNCLTKYYSELYEKGVSMITNSFSWSKKDNRLNNEKFKIFPQWNYNIPLRKMFERRQALVEIDVLTSMALGLTFGELKSIYRIQFPVLQDYENNTWYDVNGRIVFTNNRSLIGVGVEKNIWDTIKDMKEGETYSQTITDDTMPGGPIERTITYVAPFDKCDRIADYETAWKFFEQKYGKK